MSIRPEVRIIEGDSLQSLKELEPESLDAVATDPDYEFQVPGGGSWVGTGTAYQAEFWAEVARVLKPGAHLLSFGGSRTWHRLAVAIEDGGFEIRDCMMWLYGTGMPKSLDVSKAIDKHLGVERTENAGPPVRVQSTKVHAPGMTVHPGQVRETTIYQPTAPASEQAQQYDGWGTALKPAVEPIILARKPLSGTVAANTLEHGVGGLNLGAARIGSEKIRIINYDGAGPFGSVVGRAQSGRDSRGRWPANVLLDETAAQQLDDQTGNRGVSRFFYTAKTRLGDGEKPEIGDVSHPTTKPLALMRYLLRLVVPPGGTVLDPFSGSGSTAEAAVLEGFSCVALERESKYVPLIEFRVERARNAPATLEEDDD